MTAATTADDKIRLAQFARRNKATGGEECLRVEATSFGGYWYLNLRIWFAGRRPVADDDGFRPSKAGLTVREDELDALAEAVAEARRIVRAEGRATCPPDPTERKSKRDQPRHYPNRARRPDDVRP